MDTTQWPQEIVVKPLEQIGVPVPDAETMRAPKPNINGTSSGGVDRKPQPQKVQALNCPRCNSTNTKFCYYNNYSLSQPRYFCKACRRYWTEGGSLRNIPVGGGSRKNKGRPSSSSSSSTSSPSTSASSSSAAMAIGNPQPLDPHHGMSASKMRDVPSSSSVMAAQNPTKRQDINLGSSSLELMNSKGLLSSLMSMPLSVPHHDPNFMYTPPPPAPHGLFPGFLEMKPTGGSLGFSLGGLSGGFRSALHDSASNIDNGDGRLLFPFQELKQTNHPVEHHEDGRSADHAGHHHQPQQQQQQQHQGSHHHQHHHPDGFWSGMLGGGSW
ncbi:hypothetical protein SAY86_012730 [Trapa natans]|uniref:Dof zinc finger protein n=1 Tax=Trapa natans TaxID=22666 RepID=A0AAN7MDQ5_TRANT|nr:hypothetical protein SAY86_012730 [Trapa natans]